jgi:hypothetical protein
MNEVEVSLNSQLILMLISLEVDEINEVKMEIILMHYHEVIKKLILELEDRFQLKQIFLVVILKLLEQVDLQLRFQKMKVEIHELFQI